MKRYKRLFAILLGAAVILSLAGCGTKKNEKPADDTSADVMPDNTADISGEEDGENSADGAVIVDGASKDDTADKTEKEPRDWLIEIPESLASDFVPLKDIPEDYSAEQAETDGFVVYKDLEIAANEARYDEFVQSLVAGERDHIREAYFFEMFATEDGANKFTVVDKYCVDGIVVTRTNRGEFESEMRYYRSGEEQGAIIDSGWTGYDNDPEKAAEDGCLVIDGRKSKGDLRKDDILSGLERWNEFEADIEQGIPSSVRVARLSEGAAKKDTVTVYEVRFDGTYYYLAYYSEYDFGGCSEPCVAQERFEHMVKLEDAQNANRYVCALTHDEKIGETPYEELVLTSGVCYFVTPVDAGE